MNIDDLFIRPMTKDDIPEGMRLKSASGWNQTADDWRMYIDADGGGCWIAEYDGAVAGTVSTISYGGRFSWIGMMLVDPAYRRQGIGGSLMRHAIGILAGKGAIRLDATPLGKTVYDRLGFVDEYGLVRMTRGTVEAGEATVPDVSPVTIGDLKRIRALDYEVFGADRHSIIERLMAANPESAWKIADSGGIRAFTAGRPGSKFYQIGPVVAHTCDEAAGVLAAALDSLDGCPVVVDAPSAQEEFLARLTTMGFREERPFIRMRLGENLHPGDPGRVFAVYGPELG